MKVAVIYQSVYSYVNKLYGPPNDAKLMESLFRKLGYDVLVIKEKRAIPDDIDIVYMSGHGTVINGEGVFLCPKKNRKKVLKPTDYYVGSELPEKSLIILDACFAGKFRDVHKSTIRHKTTSKEPIQLKSNYDRAISQFMHTGLMASTQNSYASDLQVDSTWNGAYTLVFNMIMSIIDGHMSISTLSNKIQRILNTLEINQEVTFRITDDADKAIVVYNQFIKDIINLNGGKSVQ